MHCTVLIPSTVPCPDIPGNLHFLPLSFNGTIECTEDSDYCSPVSFPGTLHTVREVMQEIWGGKNLACSATMRLKLIMGSLVSDVGNQFSPSKISLH